MWVYPWDLVDEGFDVVLDRLQGEVGLSGVTVPVACAATRYLRVREVAPRWVVHAGGLCFHPDEERYHSTRCKPAVAAGFKARDALREAIEQCGRRGLELFASVSASRIGRMAERHPEMATVNVFDAPSGESLCLSNPDVRAFLRDLLADLTHERAIAGLIVEDFDIAWAEADHLDLPGGDSRSPTSPSAAVSRESLSGDAERGLFRLCFCPSCLQGAEGADVDATAAKRSVAVILQKALDAGPASASGLNLPAVIADDPPLREMLSWRRSSLAELYDLCAKACHCPIAVCVSSPEEAAMLQSSAESPLTLLIATDRPAPPSWLDRMTPAKWEVRLGPASIRSKAASEVVRAFQAFVQAGCRSVELAHYGILPESMMVAVRQAVRFDRRAGSGG
jgi:hypothetical protein